ncbi:ABC transporter permease [Agrococcus sediminis]|uniref:ABC transporter permease n=1 Tax=Agrococcus sediminis TaxID=2599924 RepID=A0A5M8Q7P5_9MICO|nr:MULTISPECIES: ABC transporter permease [Agrococcus]KAA6430886.1 ABC transporter permease [Agrococcus sediminis]MDR7235103.1 simple sugar transport system permease protein [Agrococcus sp. BE272]RWR19765.1 ABC transporter permease [Agrococcus lahaulensis]
MTAQQPTTQAPAQAETVELERAVVKHWKAPISYAVLTLVALLLTVVLGRDGSATLRLASSGDLFQLPDAVLPARATGIVIVILLAALTALSFWAAATARRLGVWLPIVFGVLFVVAFLTWAGAGSMIPIAGLLFATVGLSVPLILGAMGGVLSERAGVVNIAIEAQLLGGAFTGAVVASATGSTLVGVVAAMLASVLVSMVLAVFAIRYFVEQVIVGVVLNVLVAGLTNFFYSSVLTDNPALNSPVRLPKIPIPLLESIPLIGPALFKQTIIVYAMYVIVPLIAWGLFKTTWGLRLRAIGEHPMAADTVGIKVNRLRFWNVALAGAVAGLGGAYFTLDSNGSFTREMTAGLGYIALAAVIFGQWHPIKATLAALLFGFASALQQTLGAIGSPVPSEFMLMLPYVITLLAVAGFIGRSRPPAASGKPYVKQ